MPSTTWQWTLTKMASWNYRNHCFGWINFIEQLLAAVIFEFVFSQDTCMLRTDFTKFSAQVSWIVFISVFATLWSWSIFFLQILVLFTGNGNTLDLSFASLIIGITEERRRKKHKQFPSSAASLCPEYSWCKGIAEKPVPLEGCSPLSFSWGCPAWPMPAAELGTQTAAPGPGTFQRGSALIHTTQPRRADLILITQFPFC